MKDSGVEWLGEVPEHCGTKRLKYLVKEPLLFYLSFLYYYASSLSAYLKSSGDFDDYWYFHKKQSQQRFYSDFKLMIVNQLNPSI
ncbi:MAG: hypothetical protein JKX78_12035 [Alteromonadaceae bacterium]|nr:hypothetical protein [Alteromonadaceae bacterium]